MKEKYKIVLYQQTDKSWAAYLPAIPGCHAIMPTQNQVLEELEKVFSMIKDEYAERNQKLPDDVELSIHAK